MRILAVDDEFGALTVLIDEIKHANKNAEVYGAQFPEEALRYAGEHTVDVAFLDIEMPQMSGISLAKQLKKYNPDINIIFVTAYENYAIQALGLYASGYVLKPITENAVVRELENLRFPVKEKDTGVRVVTFGQFDILVDGVPIRFKRSKSKELIAYLVDRHGCGITKREVAAVLFENEEYTRSIQDYINKIVRELESSLKEVKASQIFIKRHNYYAVNTEKFVCDLYEYEKGNPEAINSFHGEYMSQYSWGEMTLGNLFD